MLSLTVTQSIRDAFLLPEGTLLNPKMNSDIKYLAQSLVETGKVLMAKGVVMEQVLQQEAVSALVGYVLLAEGEISSHSCLSPSELTVRLQPQEAPLGVLAMAETDFRVLRDAESGALAVLARVHDESDWEGLPLHIQNYVQEADFPCHLVFPIAEMNLAGDVRPRHYALPAFFKVSFDEKAVMRSKFVFADPDLRGRHAVDPTSVNQSAAVDLDPFVRLLGSYMVDSAEAMVSARVAECQSSQVH